MKLHNGSEDPIEAQESDTDLINLYNNVLSVEEADKVPACYFVKDGVLMRKYRPPGIPAQISGMCTNKLLCLQSTDTGIGI